MLKAQYSNAKLIQAGIPIEVCQMKGNRWNLYLGCAQETKLEKDNDNKPDLTSEGTGIRHKLNCSMSAPRSKIPLVPKDKMSEAVQL
jgi:hypothetical protein